MLIVFKAHSCADVVMLEENGREMLALIGKEASADRGVVTLEQLPEAISALRRAAAVRREPRTDSPGQLPGGPTEEGEDEVPPVQLFQRAQPVLNLLDQALQARTPVTWGV